MANFIKAALDKILTEGNQFPSVKKYIEMEIAFGNPPWKIKRKK